MKNHWFWRPEFRKTTQNTIWLHRGASKITYFRRKPREPREPRNRQEPLGGCKNCKIDECLLAAAWPPPFSLSRARSTSKIHKNLEPIFSKRWFLTNLWAKSLPNAVFWRPSVEQDSHITGFGIRILSDIPIEGLESIPSKRCFLTNGSQIYRNTC